MKDLKPNRNVITTHVACIVQGLIVIAITTVSKNYGSLHSVHRNDDADECFVKRDMNFYLSIIFLCLEPQERG